MRASDEARPAALDVGRALDEVLGAALPTCGSSGQRANDEETGEAHAQRRIDGAHDLRTDSVTTHPLRPASSRASGRRDGSRRTATVTSPDSRSHREPARGPPSPRQPLRHAGTGAATLRMAEDQETKSRQPGRACYLNSVMSHATPVRLVLGLGLLATAYACADVAESPQGPSPLPSATATSPVSPPPIPPPLPRCGEAEELPKLARRDEGTLVLSCEGAIDELAVTPLADGLVRLRYGKSAAGSIVPVERAAATEPLRLGRRGESAVLCTREIEMALVPGTCRIVVKDVATGAVIVDDGPQGGFYRGRARVAGESTERDVIGISRSSPPNERFYGLGLHTRSKATLDLRGKVVDLYNTDAYDTAAGGFAPDATSLYESIPFYIGLRAKTAYGVFTDNTHRMRFDLGSTVANEVRTMAFGGTMDQVLVVGPSIRDVVRRYTNLTGRMSAPPTWTLGFHQSRWEGPCEGSPAERPFCSAAQIKGLVGTFRDRKIPLDAVFLDIQHMRGLRTFTFDPDRFPNPAGFVSELEALGVQTQIIVDPGLKIDPAWDIYTAGLSGGHYLTLLLDVEHAT